MSSSGLGKAYKGDGIHCVIGGAGRLAARGTRAVARETADKRGEAINLGRLGDTYRDQGQIEAAIQQHEQGLALTRQMDDKRGEGYGLADLATDYQMRGEFDKAVDAFQQARTIFDGLGMQHMVKISTASLSRSGWATRCWSWSSWPLKEAVSESKSLR